MPWTTGDVDRHKKGLGDKQKETWVKVANGALKRCLGKGGKQDACEASAIRQANAVAGGQAEGAEQMSELAQIAASAIETAMAITNDSGELSKEQANALLEALRGDLDRAAAEKGDNAAEIMTITVNDERVPLSELIDTYRRLQEAPTKKVSGRTHGRGDFLVVEDADKPTTWHLPVKVDGKPDHRLMGGAWAALHGGYRGQKYGGPDKAGAIAKLRALYKSEDMEVPAGEMDFGEAAVGIDTVRAVLAYLIAQLPDEEETSTEEETKESALAESASGAAISLVEAEPAADGARAPLLLDVALIRPGWGNKRDNHYYSRELLQRDAKVFEGVKMYATDHRQDEKSVRTEVASVKQIVGFTDDGAPIARVAVHDPDFAEATRNRAQLDTLKKLECSILARGPTRPGEIDGRKGYIVEAITAAQSVDWVTSGGAGGHALNLAESATDDGGEGMSDEKKEKKVEEQDGAQEQKKTEAHVLSEDTVASILSESNLPDPAKERLTGAAYEDEEAVEAAVQREVDYLKEITGSGEPFAQGQTQPPAEKRISEVDLQKQFDAIDQRHGLYVEVNDDNV